MQPLVLLLSLALGCGARSTRLPVDEIDGGADADADSDSDSDADSDTDDACPPDANEPDDTAAMATPVENGSTFQGLTLCDGDEDFFVVDLDVGQQLIVNVVFAPSDSQQIKFDVLAPDGSFVMTSGAGPDGDGISLILREYDLAGRYALRVYVWHAPGWERYPGGEGNTYDLVVRTDS